MSEQQAKSPPATVPFHFGKSNFFRVIYADGAIGSVSPRNSMIQVSFYNERIPIPTKTAHEVTPEVPGKGLVSLGSEVMELRKAKDGIFREVEVEVVLTLQSARELTVWLSTKIEELEAREKK